MLDEVINIKKIKIRINTRTVRFENINLYLINIKDYDNTVLIHEWIGSLTSRSSTHHYDQ